MASTKIRQDRELRGHSFVVKAVLTGVLFLSVASQAVAEQKFDTPVQAVDALVAAARSGQMGRLQSVLGPKSNRLLRSGDAVADRQALDRFLAAFDEAHRVEDRGDGRAVLIVGKEEWPFPVPAVKQVGGWQFDVKAGEQEILDRRIGANELDAIEVCNAYADAQRDYAATDRDNDGLLEYAQTFMSKPSARDGLYWPTSEGEGESPMGPLMARARGEGYSPSEEGKPTPYHGYYYRILKAQGPNAPGGAMDYMVRGDMIGGFALVAYPAQYGVSGIMTFVINHEGIVLQKDLGADSAKRAKEMTRYDPDASWKAP